MSASKRARSDDDSTQHEISTLISRPISPPPVKRSRRQRESKTIASPWKLTWIRDLPEELNRDAVSLKDILGDPLISECWEFNYLHDVPFLMDAFDPDVRHLVQVHIVHGFWKREDANRLQLLEDAKRHPNVQLHAAYMPEMFGTHHSKMMILFRHDETAEIIIHTANMIPKDWTNMTNGVWQSPRLPLLSRKAITAGPAPSDHPMGSGERFKADLQSYLRFYDRERRTCKALSDKLVNYDFASVRAALIASVPGTHAAHDLSQTSWGWSALKRCLREVSCVDGQSEVVVQISSIATLGANDDWLQKTLFSALATSKVRKAQRPSFKVVFPTADEIRRSLDGYASGGSIHTKTQSAQQSKQLQYLRPIFHHWANDSCAGAELPGIADCNGGRNRAAPHIKTYIRYNEAGSLDWAILTSANLSKQAWGEAERNTGELRIASWEIGVAIWPDLFVTSGRMVGTFQSDTPLAESGDVGEGRTTKDDASVTIGVRIPYSIPLQRYGPGECPWVATQAYAEPDCLGRSWISWAP